MTARYDALTEAAELLKWRATFLLSPCRNTVENLANDILALRDSPAVQDDTGRRRTDDEIAALVEEAYNGEADGWNIKKGIEAVLRRELAVQSKPAQPLEKVTEEFAAQAVAELETAKHETQHGEHVERVTAQPTASEAAVARAATVISQSPGIDKPKLPPVCWQGLAREVLEAALRADGSGAKVPEGWKLVPVELDENTLLSLLASTRIIGDARKQSRQDYPEHIRRLHRGLWTDALAAAPSPEGNDQSDGSTNP